jgi:uncharacterized protein (DUF885 family)
VLFAADPVRASLAGIHDRDAELPNLGEAAERALAERLRRLAGTADRVDRSGLAEADRLTLHVIRAVALDSAEVARTAEELHPTGLETIARLAEEYAELSGRVFGSTDATEVMRRLRDDPTLRFTSAAEMLEEARRAIARAEEVAPRWFGRVPTERCRVEPVPEAEAARAPGAYYEPAALDGSRPGTYRQTPATLPGRPCTRCSSLRSTRRCPATTSRARWPRAWPRPRCCGGCLSPTGMTRDGLCTASGSPTKWASTPTTWPGSAC